MQHSTTLNQIACLHNGTVECTKALGRFGSHTAFTSEFSKTSLLVNHNRSGKIQIQNLHLDLTLAGDLELLTLSQHNLLYRTTVKAKMVKIKLMLENRLCYHGVLGGTLE